MAYSYLALLGYTQLQLEATMPFPSAITGVTNNPQLRLLNALRENRKPIMTFMGIPSFRHAQIVASTGLDVRLLYYICYLCANASRA
jgi:4-hydroxy-2-oxoheptanedioate aldolase